MSQSLGDTAARAVDEATHRQAPPLALRLLGGLSLGAPALAEAAAGRPSTAPSAAAGLVGRHHVQALLALAGSSGMGMGRDELVELLWPKLGAAAGRNRLYHTVHLARQALSQHAWDDEWVVVRGGRVALDERVWCDVQALERFTPQTAAGLSVAELHQLLGLCQGDWMPALELGEAGQQVRLRVRQAQARVLREAVRRLRDHGDSPALRAHLQNLLRIEATDEPSYRELMALDLQAGRWHAVLRTYEVVCRELSALLGLRPTAATSAIAAAASASLQRVALSPGPEAGAQLLLGRESLVQHLVRQMSEQPGVWNITGLSGVGKTSVLREVARRLAPSMPDGVLFICMGDLSPDDSAGAACARALGTAPTVPGDDLSALGQALQLRQMLLVLDDLDAAADAQQLMHTLPAPAQTRLVVVSRAPLLHRHAVQVPVDALEVPAEHESLDQARHRAGYALFMMRCASSGSHSPSLAWQQEVARLVSRLDGLPLAIELAAARTTTLTPGEILRQIEAGQRPLEQGPLNLSPRHRSLQSSLDWTTQLLQPQVRAAYAAVAVFPAAFSHADALVLATVVGLSPAQMEGALLELQQVGLLKHNGDERALRMLHLPREHARAMAVTLGHWPQVVQARLDELGRRLDGHLLQPESPVYTVQLRQVAELEADAVALLEHARHHAPRQFLRMLMPLCEFWMTRSLTSVVLHWSERALPVAQSLQDAQAELWLRAGQAQALQRSGRLIDAERLSQSLPSLIERVSDPMRVAHAVAIWATALRGTGQTPRAVVLCERTLEQLQLQPQDSGFWTLYERLLMMRAGRAHLPLDLATLRPRFAGSLLWMNLLDTAFAVGAMDEDWGSQEAIAQEMIAASQALRQHRFLLSGTWHLAACELALDRADDAVRTLNEYYTCARGLGWHKGAARAQHLTALLRLRQGRPEAAVPCIHIVEQHHQQGTHEGLVVSLPLLRSRLLVQSNDIEAAVREWLTAPVAWLQRATDEHLVDWSETGALIAQAMGLPELGRELATAMRLLDGADDHIPIIRRDRDTRFGPGPPRQSSESAAMESLRGRVRAAVTELRSCLLHKGSVPAP